MTAATPVLCFDTSVHNHLIDIGDQAKPICAAIKSEFFFRFAGLALEELFSSPDAARRIALFEGCRQLTVGEWDCTHPHYEILKLLIKAHAEKVADFNWLTVDVRSDYAAHEVRHGLFAANNALSTLQRQEQANALSQYKQMWACLRTKLDKVYAITGKSRPNTFREVFQEHGSSLISSIGKVLYDLGLGVDPESGLRKLYVDTNPSIVEGFIYACPPFHALLCANLLSWYDLSLRDRRFGESFGAGRNDLYMAANLPYCDKFITGDREQERCLREIAFTTGIGTKIQSYDDFVKDLQSDGC